MTCFIAGGIAFKYVNSQILNLICVVTVGTGVALIPHLLSLYFLYGVYFVLGIALCIAQIGESPLFLPQATNTEQVTNKFHTEFVAGCVVGLQVLWGEKSGAFLQIFNFGYGAGAIIAPLICQPYLKNIDADT